MKHALLMTRPKEDAARFVAALEPQARAALRVICSPLLSILQVGVGKVPLGTTGVIFSSVKGVAAIKPVEGVVAYCVGPRTASFAQQRGWQVGLTAHDAALLVESMLALRPPGRLVHICGVHHRGDIAETLSEMGMPTERQVVYDQKLLGLTAEAVDVLLSCDRGVIVPLFSPRTAAQLAQEAPTLQNAIVVAMSPAVVSALAGAMPRKVLTLDAPTGDEMLRIVENLAARPSLP